MNRRIVVTGGAGYIGSHTVHLLLSRGFDVIVVDNLSSGLERNVPDGRLVKIDLHETARLTEVLAGAEAVIHFAASIAVGESVRLPEKYFHNNIGATASLLSAMMAAGVTRLVFSSTAAVYGTPAEVPIPESSAIEPINPYGESKAIVERLLDSMSVYRGLRSIRLRYFNACGAAFGLGEEHEPETHLIPLVLRAIRSGKPIQVFGDDYPTPDGTCVRDYIHVADLAEAHLAALEWLAQGGETGAYNCGTGRGYSVMEVIRTAESITGQRVPYTVAPRREGDPAELVAEASRLQSRLGWSPQHSDLAAIIQSAWDFEQRRGER